MSAEHRNKGLPLQSSSTTLIISTLICPTTMPSSTHASGTQQVLALLSVITSAANAAMAEYSAHGFDVPSIHSLESHPIDLDENALELRKAIKKLEGACNQLCATLAPPSHTLLNKTIDTLRDCLLFALETKVADVIADHPGGIHILRIADSIGVEHERLDIILRRLATESFFCEVSPHVYAPSRLTKPLLSTESTSDGAYIPALVNTKAAPALCSTLTSPELGTSLESQDTVFLQSVNSRIDSTQEKYTSFYHWASAHPKIRNKFDRAMIGQGKIVGNMAVLQCYPWNDVRSLCDIGSGIGAFSIPLAKAHPKINITLFDQPEVMEQAKTAWNQHFTDPGAQQNDPCVIPSRIQFLAGNFLEGIGAHDQDVYYLRNVLHNWPDHQCRVILENIRRAMGKNPQSRVLIHGYIVQHALPTGFTHSNGDEIANEEQEEAPYPLLSNYGAGNARMYDMNMTMLLSSNGKERTLQNVVEIAKDADLELVRVWEAGETSLIELKARS